MIVHLALEGVMEGAIGLGVDVIDTARRLLSSRKTPSPRTARMLTQRVVSLHGKPVVSMQGRKIGIEGSLEFDSLRSGTVLVIPGIFTPSESSVGSLLARRDVQRVVAALPRALQRGAVIAASCSATFLLGAAGVLDQKSATTTWWLMPSFARRFPKVALQAKRMVVDGGCVLTAGSAFAHADLMLAIVARLTSPAVTNLTARYLVLDARASQSRYMVMEHLRGFDPGLRKLDDFVALNMQRQVSLAELARTVGTSARTLARRIKASSGETPQRLVQRMRIAHAVHLLETTRESVEEIATQVGYSDASTFRRIFRKHTGDTPQHWRG